MTLDDYLKSPDAMSVSALRVAINVKSDSQISQWRNRWKEREPSPENCVAIEVATEGKVSRWDLRPDDWHRIWPELIGKAGAPIVELKAAA